MAEQLKIIPLGGLNEIGKNMTVYEYGGEIIVVDCGMAFPGDDMYGIDCVIPDVSYLVKHKNRIRGMFITHGHEDHIGAVPYILKKVNIPIYCTRLTAGLIRLKLEEHGLLKSTKIVTVESGMTVKAGKFSVEFIHVNHSIADAFMFAIRTPIGIIMHSGDFKIDYTPINGAIMDLQRIAQIGREGVLLFVCESTNIEVPGFSKSERHVGESMADMIKDAKGRIFVATFSSNVSRLQQIFTAAERHGRKVALVGRSMLNVFNAANNLGYIQKKPDTLIEISQVDNYPPEQVVIISTGSQGEPMSALTRIAFSNHREIEIQPGDTVIISATPIPGNEKPIYKVINELYRRGAKVYYSALADVHVSGHASQEEIKLVHALVRPKFFIPAHGETRMLYQHAELAHKLGVPFENIFILANGDIFEISKGSARVTGFTNGDAVLIDGASVGEVDNSVLRERKLLYGISSCYTRANFESITSEEYYDSLIRMGAYFIWYFHYMPVGNDASPELLPTPEQRTEVYRRIRRYRAEKPLFAMDFQNDAEFVGGCIAGGRTYLHINANGDVDPCVFIHYSDSNIREKTLLETMKSPLFMAYHDGQPFNDNMLRPCPMLENPEKLRAMVKSSGAHSTDLQSPETVDHLCAKCDRYAAEWKPTADKLWAENRAEHDAK